MIKAKTLVFTLLTVGIASQMRSQTACLTTGGQASSADGSVSYSIGQIDYLSTSNTVGSVHQGVQQPYELFEIIGVSEIGHLVDMLVFPNPASQHVMVVVNGDFTHLNIELYDAIGKLISKQPIYAMQTQLSLSDLRNGVYFLRLCDTYGAVKGSLQLIKTQ